ncbi:Integrase superfamily protein [Desulfonema limicola]|uniref:Integrase superfamily protein n=1 Tax=Desulfonema limicola TaxID=45656 RepID=A0A975GKL1_9BACT|nr:site-specific integrase [Desulfonema limicola]QTA83908.1 Integrase superfamily protein [Desulfonema limicola]
MGIRVREKDPGSGEWWVFSNYKGERTSKKIGKNKRLANQVAESLRKRQLYDEIQGCKDEKHQALFADYAVKWLEGYVTTALKISTYRGYESILRVHLIPEFEKRNLKEITRPEIKDFLYKKLNSGLSYGRVKRINAVLSGIFTHALEDGIIKSNPATGLDKFFTSKDNTFEINPYTTAELDHFLETIRNHFPKHYPFYLTLALTGMRLGEVIGLQWGDIDFHGNFIKVRRALTEKKEVTTPKSGKSRAVTMTPYLSETLKNLKLERKKQTLKQRNWEKVPEWIFINEKGNPVDRGNLTNRVHNKACEKAGLRRTRIHDIRHSYATMRITAGHETGGVSNQMGHSTIRITNDIYCHRQPGHDFKEVSELDQMLNLGTKQDKKRAVR